MHWWWCSRRRSWLWCITAHKNPPSSFCGCASFHLSLILFLSNLTCVLSNSSCCYAACLIPPSSCIISLLPIVYYSDVACLLSTPFPHLLYVSPLMTQSSPQLCSLSLRGDRYGCKSVAYCLMVCGVMSEVYSSEI